ILEGAPRRHHCRPHCPDGADRSDGRPQPTSAWLDSSDWRSLTRLLQDAGGTQPATHAGTAAAAIGREIEYPCNWWHPSDASRSPCAGVSTPSAITVLASMRAVVITPAAIAMLRSSWR